MSDRTVSRERVVQAPASIVFDILADPRMHLAIDGSGMLQDRLSGPTRLSMGAHFGMRMKLMRLPYVIRNTIVEFEEDRRIAWRHLFRHVWRYELEAQGDDQTLVRETFDYAPSIYPWVLERLDVPRAHERNIERTLENLGRIAAERAAEAGGDIAG